MRILTFGYDANVTAFTDGTSKDRIHNHAEHLVGQLVANRSVSDGCCGLFNTYGISWDIRSCLERIFESSTFRSNPAHACLNSSSSST